MPEIYAPCGERQYGVPTPDEGGVMYARVATFESDPAEVDQAIEMVRSSVESEETPEGLEGARMLMNTRLARSGFARTGGLSPDGARGLLAGSPDEIAPGAC